MQRNDLEKPDSSSRATVREIMYADDFKQNGQHATVREIVTLYPAVFRGWEVSKEPYFFKTHQEYLQGGPIDYFSRALTMDLFHELSHTRGAAYCKCMNTGKERSSGILTPCSRGLDT